MLELSQAQYRALQATARVDTTREAAIHLGISEQTLKNQLTTAFRKLGVRNRNAAFRRMGWLRAPTRHVFVPAPH